MHNVVDVMCMISVARSSEMCSPAAPPQTKRVGCDNVNGLEDAAVCKKADSAPYCEPSGDIAQVRIPKPYLYCAQRSICICHGARPNLT